MTTQKREFDVIVFGATGYTGQILVEKLASVGPREQLTWAIAGRSKRKLEECLAEAEKNVAETIPNVNLKNVPIVICDISDEESINNMCKRARIILNCAGPYMLYGEQVVRACVANGTSHIDISGETVYLGNMVIKYSKEAEENGAFVIGACGFESAAIESCLQYVEEQFAPGEVNDVEAYFRFTPGPAGYKVNTGTLHSVMKMFGNVREMSSSLKQLEAYDKFKLPKAAYPGPSRGLLHRRSDLAGWSVPFTDGPTTLVVKRTQGSLFNSTQHRPIQLVEYMHIGSLFNLITLMFGFVIIFFLSQLSITRKLVLTYPSLFTFGYFSNEGPTRKQVEQATFSFKLFARGWRSKNAEELKAAPNRLILVELHGPDCTYVTSAICMLETAVSILKEREKIGLRGGVLTPGLVTRNTDFLKRLQSPSNGFNFKVSEL